MKKLRIAQTMMVVTILLIIAFQSYWISKLYNNEWNDLKKETDVLFRETVYKLQVSRFKKDTTIFRAFPREDLFAFEAVDVIRKRLVKDTIGGKEDDVFTGSVESRMDEESDTRQINKLHLLPNNEAYDSTGSVERSRNRADVKLRIYRKNALGKHSTSQAQTSQKKTFIRRTADSDSIALRNSGEFLPEPAKVPHLIKIIARDTLLNDSLPLKQIDSFYGKELAKAGINVPYAIVQGAAETMKQPKPLVHEFKTNPAFVGIINPRYYQAVFHDPFLFIVNRIAPQLILSFILVAFTVITFVVLYRNLIGERRIADIKNEFISNITHELKTPIATVNVAIEAMRNFNALRDPERTQEYLDISAAELQRLALLVDKVLKLTLFEKKEIELKKESFNFPDLIKEVTASMRLQFDKYKAKVNLHLTGKQLDIHADKLHITSVVFNLLDNALKYSSPNPQIDIELKDEGKIVSFSMRDNGIGIPSQYREKIFEKFFRVPADDTHNIKGYGLGLSYVSHIVQQHNGIIELESEVGEGSTFTIRLPR